MKIQVLVLMAALGVAGCESPRVIGTTDHSVIVGNVTDMTWDRALVLAQQYCATKGQQAKVIPEDEAVTYQTYQCID